jgi:hypothetical protein
MTPTPPQKREEAARSVFAGPLIKKSWRKSTACSMKRRQVVRGLHRRMFCETVARLIAILVRARSANRNERRYESAQKRSPRKDGTPYL